MKALLSAFLLLAPTTQASTVPAPPCILPAEVEHATLFALPSVLDGLGEMCRPSLPASAYLLTGGAQLSQRVAAQRNVHWDAAKTAILRLAGDDKAAMLNSDTAALLLRDLIRGQAGTKLTRENCATVDRALALLAPLPPENLAGLVSLFAQASMTSDGPTKPPAAGAISVEVKAPEGGAERAKPLICPVPAPASPG